MAQLRQDYQHFSDLDSEVVVAGPEGAGSVQELLARASLTIYWLADPSHKVLRLFGQQIKLFKLGRMPAQVVVDKKGTARFVHYGDLMSDIPDNQELLELLAKLNADG